MDGNYMRTLEDYREIVGDRVLNDIYRRKKTYGKRVLHINSTYQGGGVAEILNSLVLLMNDVGVQTDWKILHGTPDFFTITKKFHNGLQGDSINISAMKKRIYYEVNKKNSVFTSVDQDFVIVHDPQPLPIIRFYQKTQPWVWRCHIDLSEPYLPLWEYLTGFVSRYDKMIVSMEDYKRNDLQIDQQVIMPAIDPLTPKNKKLPERTVSKYLSKNGIERDKPIIAQVSRFDKWKDPLGVIKVFELVKEKVDCQLVWVGNMVVDDPESTDIYNEVIERTKERDDITILANVTDIVVNAVQRASTVMMQKSIREGFSLTVSEALWKGTPVVASNVGGIPLQVINGDTGYLVEPHDVKGTAKRVIKILQNEKIAKKIGKRAKEHVRENFLITRLLSDYLGLLEHLSDKK